MALTEKDVQQIVSHLRRQGTDDATVEAKSCTSDLTKDVWETVSAFGNTRGGVLILGLDERRDFAPVEGFRINRVLDQFVSSIGDGGADNCRVSNPPHYEVTRVEFEGSPLLVIEIEEVDARLKPCFITNRGVQSGSYKRVDDKDVRLSPVEIYELQNALVPSPADRAVVEDATIDDLDAQLVDRLIDHETGRNAKSLRGVLTREEQLERLNVTDKTGGIRLAGLLAVGLYPQQFYPKLVVDVAVHPDSEKSAPGAPRFIDREACEGPLVEVVEEAVRAVARNLRRHSYVEGTGRYDELEIPEEVLREAVVNAVVHREYSAYFVGQAVSVDIYPDRVVVTNPGGLWGDKTLETLADGSSRCRNDTLMRLMTATPLPGRRSVSAEGEGGGIPFMIREMESRLLDTPRFEVGIDQFAVILSRSEVVAPGNRPRIQAATGDGLSCGERAVPLAAGHSDSQARILELFAEKSTMGMRAIAEGAGLSMHSARYYVKKLVDAGEVVAFGSPTSRNRVYGLASKNQSPRD